VGVKLIRAAEFILAYMMIFVFASIFRPRISLSLTDDNIVTYLFFRGCKMIGIPIDLVCHDVRTHQGDLPLQRIKMMSDADRIIVHSSHAVDAIEGIKAEYRRKVIEYPFPFGSDAAIISEKAKLKAKSAILVMTKGSPYFLFAGIVRTSKGIIELLNAWEQSEAKQFWKLVIAGKWSNVPQEVRDFAGQAKNCIVIDRYLDDEEFAGYIECAGYVVLPYLDYTHSSVLFASADHGAAVIVSDIAVFSELLPNYTLTFSKGHVLELANTLDKAVVMTASQRLSAVLGLKSAVMNHGQNLAQTLKRVYG
jgi:glycosyltransferase involved in cell wall biosynthesis